jgi:hypothetical protein
MDCFGFVLVVGTGMAQIGMRSVLVVDAIKEDEEGSREQEYKKRKRIKPRWLRRK